ncbi:MAG: Crp/Fnr family transcriptional regulator [Pseudomonadota bacterium]
MSEEITDLLGGAEIFEGFSGQALADLAELGRRRTIERGVHLFTLGDPGDALYGVLGGRVLLTRVTSEGKEIALAAMERGDIFGELALIDGAPRSTDAVMAEAGEIYVLERRIFQSALRQQPDMALALLSVLSKRLRDTNRLVESVSFLELGPRMARLLLSLADRGEETEEGEIVLGARYTQTELAKRIAASRESVSKQIAKWTRGGIVGTEDGRLVLRDLDALNEWADDPDLER